MTEAYPAVSLHNVAELGPAEWTDSGDRLDRVPADVAESLNVAARERVRHPAGSELRFRPSDGENVAVTLSAADDTVVRPFWGEFQAQAVHELGPDPTRIELEFPEALQELDRGGTDPGTFDPRICRLRFEPWAKVAIHGVDGDCRPPEAAELPERRYLAYGTSITEGAAATGCHLTYVSRVARSLGLDPVNLGTSGSAFCDPAMADHVAARDDWGVATLALSVNMANRGFTVDQFRERASNFVTTVAAANPDSPVFCVTLLPYHADLRTDGDRERARAFREALRDVVDGCDAGRVSLVDGRDLAPASGLTTDLLHPGEAGMEAIAAGLAAEIGSTD